MVEIENGNLSVPVKNGTRLPFNTWYVALFYFCFVLFHGVSATSTDVERVFSCGRLVLPHIRNRLSAQSTRAVLCLGAWSLMGFVKDSDILEVTKMPEGPDDGGLEGNIYVEDKCFDDWEALDRLPSPILLE
jgi:hypothetical protein